MPAWAAFVGLTTVVLVFLLALARASQSLVTEREPSDQTVHDGGHAPAWGHDLADALRRDDAPGPRDAADEFTTGLLLANVALSQGFLGFVLVAGAWYFRIPLAALGVDLGDPLSTGLPALGVGVALGLVLYVANAVGAASASAFGFEADESLREMLTPDDARGWTLLLGGVLPVIAGFEELLFRAAVVGATGAGFGLPLWGLALVSSLAFAAGHGAQGPAGIVVTGLLGFVLAAAFVLTNSLLAVFVAHYLVNALEFVVSGHFGLELG
ncbi:CPBP family intramembrane glutamic endopeptidase [Halomarina litorea]|uniref:CPBP family intramembrane glutamic endopeptidase n=1 Tax=Halomarina litorea TaxID=2961595 RepID=UPI0020C29DE2|nr:CPBP family intramembrane glutamic endopeptidase [Halomarina sp. BCD28]